VTLRRLHVFLLGALCAPALGACGDTGRQQQGARPGTEATLLLDFAPGAVHAGIYTAVARGYDDAEGISLRVRRPPASTGAVELLRSGRVDFAVMDIHDLGLARERGRDVVGVMALVQRPLAAVLAAPGIRTPRALEGRRVGVTGLPSDRAVLRTVVRGGGGRPGRVRETTIGFGAVPALLGGRVAAATGFWNVEGVALARSGRGFREFRVDDYGAPSYPELVLVVTRETLDERRDEVVAAVAALARGYAFTQLDPDSSVSDLLAAERGLDRAELVAQLDAVSPAFTAGARTFGELDRTRLRAWEAWDRSVGILSERLDVDAAFDRSLVG